MNACMAADTQGDQQIRSVVSSAMMDHQRRAFAAAAAAESIALQHSFAQATEKAQRMMPPIIT
jgi:hypothetical protein